jgi:hypothetical protein
MRCFNLPQGRLVDLPSSRNRITIVRFFEVRMMSWLEMNIFWAVIGRLMAIACGVQHDGIILVIWFEKRR